MHAQIIFALAGSLPADGGASHPRPPENAPPASPLALVQAFIAACNAGQREEVRALLGPDTRLVWDLRSLGAVVQRGLDALNAPLPRLTVRSLAQVAGDTVAGDVYVTAPNLPPLIQPLRLHLLVTTTGGQLANLYGLYDQQTVEAVQEYWAANPDSGPRPALVMRHTTSPGQAVLLAFITACNENNLARAAELVTTDIHLIWDTRELGTKVGDGRGAIFPPSPHFQVQSMNEVAPDVVLTDLIVAVADLPPLPTPPHLRLFASARDGLLSNGWAVFSEQTVSELKAYEATHPPATAPASKEAPPPANGGSGTRWWLLLLGIGLARLLVGLLVRRARRR